MKKTQQEVVLDKLDDLYKEFDKRLDTIEKVLILQEENLRTHMKRSDSLERLLDKLRDNDIRPLTKHVHMVEGSLKLLGIVSIIAGIISALTSFF